MPKGLLHWCDEFELSNDEIKTSLTFAHNCCTNIFDRVFQYKIVTQILPTNEYLYRYKVKDTNICDNCNVETDTIVHRLYECEHVVPVVDQFMIFIRNDCEQIVNITVKEYLFGISGNEYGALNQIILELKKYIFYSSKEELLSDAFCEQFKLKLRPVIIKEKQIMLQNNKIEQFFSKWKNFSQIYDFMGPDLQIY